MTHERKNGSDKQKRLSHPMIMSFRKHLFPGNSTASVLNAVPSSYASIRYRPVGKVITRNFTEQQEHCHIYSSSEKFHKSQLHFRIRIPLQMGPFLFGVR